MISLVLAAMLLTVAVGASQRTKREAYALPDAAELLVGTVKTTFSCFSDGFYADVDNNCQIFHVCHTSYEEDGNGNTQQWSFLCGNQTIFNQLTFTCSSPEDAIPCSEASNFFNINERVNSGDPKEPFLTEDDILRAVPLVYNAGAAVVRSVGNAIRG